MFVGNELSVSPIKSHNCFLFDSAVAPMYTMTHVVELKHYSAKALPDEIVSVPSSIIQFVVARSMFLATY